MCLEPKQSVWCVDRVRTEDRAVYRLACVATLPFVIQAAVVDMMWIGYFNS